MQAPPWNAGWETVGMALQAVMQDEGLSRLGAGIVLRKEVFRMAFFQKKKKKWRYNGHRRVY